MDYINHLLGIPFGFILKLIYDTVNNYGLSLILFTLFARLIMVPSSFSQQKGTAKSMRLQPKIRKIQAMYKGDNKRIQEETQALYKREGHNPMNAGCLPLLITMPILFGLIEVIYKPLTYALDINPDIIAEMVKALPALIKTTADKTLLKDSGDALKNTRLAELLVIKYIDVFPKLQSLAGSSFQSIKNFGAYDFKFLGFDLGAIPSYKTGFDKLWAIPIISGISSLASGIFSWLKQRQTNPEMAKNPAMGCMTFGMPLFSVYLGFQFPVGIGIYWIASNVFAFVQTVIMSFTHNPNKLIAKLMVEETVERRSKEANLKLVAARNAK